MTIPTVRARQAGALVPDDASLVLLSVHEVAINARILAPRELLGLVLAVTATEEAMSDLAIEAPALVAAAGAGEIVAGDLVVVAGGAAGVRAATADAGAGSRVRITIPAAPRWSGAVPAAPARALDGWMMTAAGASAALRTRGVVGGLAAAPLAAVREAALAAGDVMQLAGLGPGLTPSGDDFIAGAALVDAAFARAPRMAAPDRQTLLATTTAPGATLIWLAAHHRFPAYLIAMAAALDRGDGSAVAEIAASHGATSGVDALDGVVWRLGG